MVMFVLLQSATSSAFSYCQDLVHTASRRAFDYLLQEQYILLGLSLQPDPACW